MGEYALILWFLGSAVTIHSGFSKEACETAKTQFVEQTDAHVHIAGALCVPMGQIEQPQQTQAPEQPEKGQEVPFFLDLGANSLKDLR